MSTQKMEFKTEVNQILDLMIHSLYSHKEIFLRELISNASDALDKARYEALLDSDMKETKGDWKIKITADRDAGTLTVSDNGIGMSRDEAIEALGTIAHSGTKEFLQSLKNKDIQDNPELIGQFGVGFYSAFMVADRITVLSRKAGLTVKETTAGLLIFTLAMMVWLMLTAAVSIWATSLPYSYKLSVIGMVLLIVITGLWLGRWLNNKDFWKLLIRPFFREKRLSRVLIISLLTTTNFVVNFCLIGILLFPELPLESLIFISALGALVGQGSMIQSVGGIQEFVMGLSALITGFGLLDGVQIALVSRAASIISSGAVVIYMHFAPGNTGAAAGNRGSQDRNET